ncbi:MAG: hypothetical protein V4585_01095 [Bacteroidota bacterium]|jgi:transposase InsO family protein
MKELVHIFGLKQSMSRADDPYDNAFVESLWSRLKTERPSHGWKCPKEAMKTSQFREVFCLNLFKDTTIDSDYIQV